MDKELRSVFVALLREMGHRQAEHEAFLEAYSKSLPPSDALEFLAKYDAIKKQNIEGALLELEKKFPGLAAELDDRPLIDPEDLQP